MHGASGWSLWCDLFCLWEWVRRKTEPWQKLLARLAVVAAVRDPSTAQALAQARKHLLRSG